MSKHDSGWLHQNQDNRCLSFYFINIYWHSKTIDQCKYREYKGILLRIKGPFIQNAILLWKTWDMGSDWEKMWGLKTLDLFELECRVLIMLSHDVRDNSIHKCKGQTCPFSMCLHRKPVLCKPASFCWLFLNFRSLPLVEQTDIPTPNSCHWLTQCCCCRVGWDVWTRLRDTVFKLLQIIHIFKYLLLLNWTVNKWIKKIVVLIVFLLVSQILYITSQL